VEIRQGDKPFAHDDTSRRVMLQPKGPRYTVFDENYQFVSTQIYANRQNHHILTVVGGGEPVLAWSRDCGG
jgi:hypothetical protein